MRIALDTNILAYAEGVNGTPRKKAALELVQKLPDGATLLPVQTLSSSTIKEGALFAAS